MEFCNTQIGKLVEQIKLAMLSHTPVVYIPTDQKEIIDELLFGEQSYESLLPRLHYNPSEMSVTRLEYNKRSIDTPDGKFNSIKDNYVIDSIEHNIRIPSIFVLYLSSWKEKTPDIRKFISAYLGIKAGNSYLDPKTIELYRRSLCIVVTPKEDSEIPNDIAPYIKTIHVPALSDIEIKSIIENQLNLNEIQQGVINKELLDQMVVNFRGFRSMRIKQLLDQLIKTQIIDNESVRTTEVLRTINNDKKQLLANCTGLKWEKVDKKVKAAGLEEIDKWVASKKEIFSDPQRAKRDCVDIPKGILVSGIPGSGKSLMAKSTASALDLPLISLDMGALLGGLMGESENNMINALDMADRMSPCVLWIDEIEKAFSGASSGNSSGDSGVGRRMFGKFLTWMQEKESVSFVFATSNDISNLPPELFRSERFDKKFFTFMPMAEDCAKIFAANIRKQNKEYDDQLKSLPEEEVKTRPMTLFADELTHEDVWLSLLDRCCTSDYASCELVPDENNVYFWRSKQRPTNKLFTGADISAIVKEAKAEASRCYDSKVRNTVFDKSDFFSVIEKVIRDFQPYGETNLYDIVKCFRLLYVNQFKSAAKGCILNFSNYDDEKWIYTPAEEEVNALAHPYDKVLFSTIVGAINYHAKDKERHS